MTVKPVLPAGLDWRERVGGAGSLGGTGPVSSRMISIEGMTVREDWAFCLAWQNLKKAENETRTVFIFKWRQVPHVPARFSITGDMYIYVSSKGIRTGPPDVTVRLSATHMWRSILHWQSQACVALLYSQMENLDLCSINKFVHKKKDLYTIYYIYYMYIYLPGANLSWHGVRGGVHPGQFASVLQGCHSLSHSPLRANHSLQFT